MRLHGTCFGNTIISLPVSNEACGKACHMQRGCKGYTYYESSVRPYKSNACNLKKKMCTTPMKVRSMAFYTYYLIIFKGKLLFVLLLVIVICIPDWKRLVMGWPTCLLNHVAQATPNSVFRGSLADKTILALH